MAKNIEIKEESLNQEDTKLVKKVDRMMDPAITEFPPEEKVNDQISDEVVDEPLATDIEPKTDTAPLDIFANRATAPLITKKAKQTIKNKDIVDDKLASDDVSVKFGTPLKVTYEEEASDISGQSEEDELAHQKISSSKTSNPDEYDDPILAEAISDIVAHESDEVLLVEDSMLANRAENSQPIKDKTGSHPIFWTSVALVCLLAIAIALFLADPIIFQPLSKIHIHL